MQVEYTKTSCTHTTILGTPSGYLLSMPVQVRAIVLTMPWTFGLLKYFFSILKWRFKICTISVPSFPTVQCAQENFGFARTITGRPARLLVCTNTQPMAMDWRYQSVGSSD